MRKTIIAGNWKMNKNKSEAVAFANSLKEKISNIENVEIVVCPSFVSLVTLCDILKETQAEVGAQNLHWEASGAFTGEVSAEMIEAIGCRYVIIGHSERRQFFNETDDKVNKKIKRALTSCCLIPIVCVGETLDQREQGKTNAIIRTQVTKALESISSMQMQRLIIAYEPVWAIGTGVTASPEQAEEVHRLIRDLIEELYDEQTAEGISILYGGSVKPSNIADLLKQSNIDGGLIGGASLELDSFIEMIKIAEHLSN
ncbi:MAG TPA: triose-phosphate isomerase [bacterium]|nr:triose-phosphate isomerase [bacterium]